MGGGPSCHRKRNVNIGYGIGQKHLRTCRNHTLRGPRHTVTIHPNRHGHVHYQRVHDNCSNAYTANVPLIGQQRRKACQTYNDYSDTGWIKWEMDPQGKVKVHRTGKYHRAAPRQFVDQLLHKRDVFLLHFPSNRHLISHPNWKVQPGMHKNRGPHEMWMIERVGNFVRFRAADNKKVLCSNDAGTCYFSDSNDRGSHWKIVEARRHNGQHAKGHWAIQSAITGRYLAAPTGGATGDKQRPFTYPQQHQSDAYHWWSVTGKDDQSFVWSNNKQRLRMKEISLNIPQKHQKYTWGDNYLHYMVDVGLKWVTNQKTADELKNKGYTLLRWTESSDPVFRNNWIGLAYLPMGYEFAWASNFNDAWKLIEKGYKLVRCNEGADPHTWLDNYLGYRETKPKSYPNNQQSDMKLQVKSGGYPNQSEVVLNGVKVVGKGAHWQAGRGFNVLAINGQGKPTGFASFDTHGVAGADKAFAAELEKQVAARKSDGLLITFVHDEGAHKLTAVAKARCAKYGGNRAALLKYRAPYIWLYRASVKRTIYEATGAPGSVITFNSTCGSNCTPVIDPEWYLNKHTDLKKAGMNTYKAKKHWIDHGINEQRQGHPQFSSKDYRTMYKDVPRNAANAVQHYLKVGYPDGRRGRLFSPTYGFGGLITNHLQCYIDAGDPKSYPGKGRKWLDMSGKKHQFTFSKDPDWINGQFPLLGDNVITGPPSNSFGLDRKNNGGGFAVVMALRAFSPTHTNAWNFGGKKKDCYASVTRYGGPLRTWVWVSGRREWQRVKPSTVDTVRLWAWVRQDDGSMKIYVDGKMILAGAVGKTPPPDLSSRALMINSNKNWPATLESMMIYNYGLLPQHVQSIHQWWVKNRAGKQAEFAQASAARLSSKLPRFPVKNGLQLYLDADQLKKGAKVWRDQSGNGRHISLSTPAHVKNGVFKPRGEQAGTGPKSYLMGINDVNDYTLVYRIKTGTTPGVLLDLKGYDERNNAIHLSIWKNVLYFQHGAPKSGLSANIKGYANDMHTFVFIKREQIHEIYIDGTLIKRLDRRSNVPLRASAGEVNFFKWGDKRWDGEIKSIAWFSRPLNYNERSAVEQWVNSPYMVKNSTWSGARTQCQLAGQRLCTSRDFTPGPGKPAYMPPRAATALAPTSNKPFQWLNLLTGQTQQLPKDKVVTEAHVMCCKRPKMQPYFETVGKLTPTRYLMIKKGLIIDYNIQTHTAQKPVKMSTIKGLAGNFTSQPIDSILINTPREIYLTQGRYVVKVDWIKRTAGRIKSIPEWLPALKGRFKRGRFDALLPENHSVFQIFRGSRRARYNRETGKFERLDQLNGLKGIFATGHFTAVVRDVGQTNQLLVFKEDRFIKHNGKASSEQNIIPEFRGLRPPFISDNEKCLVYAKQLSYLNGAIQQSMGNPKLLAELNQQHKKYTTLQNKTCNFVSYQQQTNDMTTQNNMIAGLNQQSKSLSGQIDNSVKSRKQLDKLSHKHRAKTTLVKEQIQLELMKKCPVDQKCTVPLSVPQKQKSKKCTRDAILQMLNQNSNPVIQQQLKQILKETDNPGLYDIRTHRDFYKYVPLDSVRTCPRKLPKAPPAGLGPVADKVVAVHTRKQNTKKAKTILSGSTGRHIQVVSNSPQEQKALNMFKKAMVEYRLKTGLTPGMLAGNTDPSQSQSQITHLKRLLVDIHGTLNKIKLNRKLNRKHQKYSRKAALLEAKTVAATELNAGLFLAEANKLHNKLNKLQPKTIT